MVMLSQPTLVNQLTKGGSFPHADCGEADADSCLIDAGHPDTVGQVEQAIGGNLSGGTYTTQLAGALSKLGVPAAAIASVGEVDAALARKHRIIVEIPSDAYGNPDPGSTLGHFILVFGFDGSSYHFMNPLGGRIMTISAVELIQCERDRGLRACEINMVMPADAGAQPGPTPPAPPGPAPPPPFWSVPFPGQVDENFPGTVDAQQGANLRSGPGTNYPQAGGPLPHGAKLNFYAFVYGEAVWDPVARQFDRRWFRIANGGSGFTPPYDGRLVASALIQGNPPNSHP